MWVSPQASSTLRLGSGESITAQETATAPSFVGVVAAMEGLVAVGVSVTSSSSVAAAGELLPALRAALPGGVLLAVGGAAVVDEAQALALGADHWAASAQEFLVQLAGAAANGNRTA